MGWPKKKIKISNRCGVRAFPLFPLGGDQKEFLTHWNRFPTLHYANNDHFKIGIGIDALVCSTYVASSSVVKRSLLWRSVTSEVCFESLKKFNSTFIVENRDSKQTSLVTERHNRERLTTLLLATAALESRLSAVKILLEDIF
ncbi:hypothetical protein T11_17104 [Trichinella zimbabwensis]|uniref:Uncharacterized protein n=1 Tax=Trichinella zimbabwensis TaxID=268475 RepID=A0A0V1HF17_9BILA|nr:hypothetical protein T11_17104 [Trichinella zimbabwensis]